MLIRLSQMDRSLFLLVYKQLINDFNFKQILIMRILQNGNKFMFTQMDDIKPLFFPTQISPELRRPQTQQLASFFRNRNDEERSLSPFQKLKRMKEIMNRSKRQYMRALSQNHRLQVSVDKLEKKKHLARAQFFKVYGNLKYKRFLEEQKSQSQSRKKILSQQKVDKTKKKRLQQQLQRMLFKNQQQERIMTLQIKNRKDKDRINQIKDKKKTEVLTWSKQLHDTVRNQNTEFIIRKSNISSVLQERSKLNYMKKVNKQLTMLKEYQNVIEDIGGFNVQEIKKLAQNDEKFKEYESFFMTTKNTLN